MGAIYTHTASGKLLRRISPEQREALLQRYYDPHHQLLTDAVAFTLASHGKCLIIDAHSFSSTPMPFEEVNTTVRPDICIGYEEYHVTPELIQLTDDFFTNQGFSIKHNSPFAGSMVPSSYYRTDPRVKSIMIEINRALYMDESTGQKLPGFDRIMDIIARYMLILQESWGCEA